ncbi:MAG: hypothetical protein D6705_03225 [Deltaproteobacteria bacterium]|nr:MAG: hypothetical protein D6705_03225 [Deltaproteobacteria bacterium]
MAVVEPEPWLSEPMDVAEVEAVAVSVAVPVPVPLVESVAVPEAEALAEPSVVSSPQAETASNEPSRIRDRRRTADMAGA